MAQNRTNGGFVSNMYEILNAYKYFRILLHFGNHISRVLTSRHRLLTDFRSTANQINGL